MKLTKCYRLVAMAFFSLIAGMASMVSQTKAKAPTSGRVIGIVNLEGTAPHQRSIDMSKEPSCAAIHKDQLVTTENVVAGPNGGLANVVVYISEGWNGVPAASPQPVLDQKGCQYLPHVFVVGVNQHFKVTNSDQTLHNVHPMPKPGSSNREWNRSQQPGSQAIDESWPAEEVAIHVKCNIHPWMSGYMVVVKGPYAISDNKGSYKIANLPPGNYTLTAWQEMYGAQVQKVTVSPGKPVTANFTFKTM
jgi:Carboxypeptidase regulatory-like domain